MKLIDAQARLQQLGQPLFRTADAAACLRIANAHASKLLERLATAGLLVHVSRGLWALPGRAEPLALPPYLTHPYPSYVSLQTALYYHGMVSQIPAIVYAVSLARTRRFHTPIGVVSVHHVTPTFFRGFEMTGRNRIPIATPEKALVDLLYLSPARSGVFRALPELEVPPSFRTRRARELVSHIPSERRRLRVAEQLKAILAAEN